MRLSSHSLGVANHLIFRGFFHWPANWRLHFTKGREWEKKEMDKRKKERKKQKKWTWEVSLSVSCHPPQIKEHRMGWVKHPNIHSFEGLRAQWPGLKHPPQALGIETFFSFLFFCVHLPRCLNSLPAGLNSPPFLVRLSGGNTLSQQWRARWLKYH